MSQFEKHFCGFCQDYMPFEKNDGGEGICCMCRWDVKPKVRGKYKKKSLYNEK